MSQYNGIYNVYESRKKNILFLFSYLNNPNYRVRKNSLHCCYSKNIFPLANSFNPLNYFSDLKIINTFYSRLMWNTNTTTIQNTFGQQWMWSTAQCWGRALHRRCQWIFQAVACGISHVCRGGVCMCWHSPLVLLDEPALANYFLNKTSSSSAHLWPNLVSNFLRWKRNKNLQAEIISFC